MKSFIVRHSMWLVWSGMMLVSLGAIAQSTVASPVADSAEYWRDVAMGSIGLVLGLVGIYARSIEASLNKLEARLESLENKHSSHELMVARDYHTASDVELIVNKAMGPVTESLKALHKRFDYFSPGKLPHE